jgi:putative redox protein
MQSLLSALAGCSSVDVISILKKQRQELTGLVIEVDGKREEGKEPSLWKEIEIIFRLEGNVESAKAKRAVDLSLEKYCSVAETLRRGGAGIQCSIYLNGSKVD